MIKTHKIALDPNRDQIAWFYQQCGYAKFAFNSALFDFKTELASDAFLSKNKLANRFNQNERKLAREQRKLSRKVFLSQNWYKQKRKVERIHYRIACIRCDAHHQATTDILKCASKIGIETLQVTNLLKNRKLAKALSDAALGGFLEKLKTKAKSLGIPILQADRFFASSKHCSTCGEKKDDLTLSDRQYQCSHCGASLDRDVNATLNLRTLAAGHAES